MFPFRRGDEFENRRKRGGPLKAIFGIFRVFLSLIIMGILLLGVYQAYRSFSGIDPLKTSPKAIIDNLLSSENLYGLIVGFLSVSPGESLDKVKQILEQNGLENPDKIIPSSSQFKATAPLLFKFAILSDSHNDNQRLKKSLEIAKSQNAKFVVGLGDYSDVGTIDELRNAKLQFDTVGLPYYVTAGDHDLWDARDKKGNALQNFSDVFGTAYQSFAYQNLRVIMMYDSDNYIGVDSLQQKWLEEELDRVRQDNPELILVMTGIPLFHLSSDHQMGKTNPALKNQAERLITLFKTKGVKEIIAGDTHFYSSYIEPKNTMKMTTVGAISATRNAQSPRFAMVEVYEDGSYNIQDTEIK